MKYVVARTHTLQLAKLIAQDGTLLVNNTLNIFKVHHKPILPSIHYIDLE